MHVEPGTIQVWSDIGCPWSHGVIWRLHDARRRLGLEATVAFDHRAFPLELFNSEPTPRGRVAAEWPVVRHLAPRAGWQDWDGSEDAWPVTMLLPMEAVQAAKRQSLAASEQLDRGLRRAFFAERRCISMRHVILEVANESDGIDVAALARALDAGTARHRITEDWSIARGPEVLGSAHLFLADGTNEQNPGIGIGWHDGAYEIERDDPGAIDEFVRRAAARAESHAGDG